MALPPHRVALGQKIEPKRRVIFSAPATGDDLLEPLSPQERRVLGLLVAGRTNPEIARELVVSLNTVKTQVKSIYRKLNISSRHEASEVARRLFRQ